MSRAIPNRAARKPSAASSPTVDLDVTSLAAGGAGIARNGSRVVLVTGAAPGDRVTARLGAGSSARVVRVISPGPDRIVPACGVHEACGACDWMHLAPEAQRREHARIVRESLAHAMGVATSDLPEVVVHAAPRELGYRTRARLRVKSDARSVSVGYRAAGSRDLVAVARCLVLDAALEPVVEDLRAVLAGSRGEGDAQIALGLDASGARRPVVDLEWFGELAPAAFGALDRMVREGRWAGARATLEGVSRAATFGDARPVLVAADGGLLRIAEGGFAQPSDEGAALLARRVAELAAPAGQHVLELFSGSGTLSVLLARGAASFSSIESEEAAVRAARDNLAARELPAKVACGDADATPIRPRTDVVVLDPPRTGARGAARAIAAARPRRVVYVSCDPATLARDVAEMRRGGMVVDAIETFELFPQTSHVEVVVALRKGTARDRGAS